MKAYRRKKKEGSLKPAKSKVWIKPFRLIFNSVMGISGLVAALLLAASAYSDIFSPEKSVLFAYLGLCFPLFIIAGLFFLFFWLFTKRWLFVFVLALDFILCWKPLTRYCPFHPLTEVTRSDDVIKLLTYNVMDFGYFDNTKDSKNKMVEYIAKSGADIVCLQEYMVGTRPNMMSSADIAAALPMYPYISEVFVKRQGNGDGYGLAVLSKFPITKSSRIRFASAYNGSALFNINVHGKKLVLINNHLESFKLTAEDRTKYSNVLTKGNLEAFEELRATIPKKLSVAFRTRARQVAIIADAIRKENGYYTVVCGDFNDTPISFAHRTMRNIPLIDSFAESGLGLGTSYNRNLFLFRIDHILHSPAMQSYNCRVDRSIKVSDHYPVSCLLRFKK
ncbi:MAG: endonuclease/exonuclease/phosphatase family protein [Tannerella sp.]|jgi:endonuclease/exonuclease/phosphatase family metal-dependent hydrolase|nr:endonuclease/exonuclease/phosphatase family protein [Tannerella sp.]